NCASHSRDATVYAGLRHRPPAHRCPRAGKETSMATRGFFGRRQSTEIEARLPPGQYLEKGLPVLSAGPTPIVKPEQWNFTVKVGPKPIKSWTWAEFNALP